MDTFEDTLNQSLEENNRLFFREQMKEFPVTDGTLWD